VAPTSRPKPTDATGKARAAEIKKNTEALKARQDEITTIAATEAARMENEVLDPKIDSAPAPVDEIIDSGSPELGDDQVVIRLIADIEQMTFGYGNNYSFKAGQKYKVDRHVADHLESLGYLYTM
jgi:hypothetical protein